MLRSLFVVYTCCVVLCIAEDEPIWCGENQEVKCVNKCPPEKTCRNRDILVSCLHTDEPCEKKCVCKEGFFKNPLGSCISEEQCNQCSGKNEFYSCGSACDNECSKINEQNRTNCPIQNIVCNRQCYCDDGYARDKEGICIPVDKCPPLQSCVGLNEEYTDCKTNCFGETCTFLIYIRSQCGGVCTPGCECKFGFLRETDDSRDCAMSDCDCILLLNTQGCQKRR